MPAELIMELTGESRETQVQPPLGAWVNFFHFDPEAPSQLKLKSVQSGAQIDRPVVRHDHNWTVEIPEAACNRPAIIRFRESAGNTYTYWIYEPGAPDFALFTALLDRYRDPSWIRGRGFLVLHGA